MLHFFLTCSCTLVLLLIIHFPDHNKGFECKICSKGFVSKSNLKRHTNEQHHAESQPKGSCDLCGKSYLLKRIKDHMRNIHVQIKFERCHVMIGNYYIHKEHLPRCKNIEYRSIKARK